MINARKIVAEMIDMSIAKCVDLLAVCSDPRKTTAGSPV
jgi:hypothetical protein